MSEENHFFKENNMKEIRISDLEVGEKIEFGHINGVPLVWRIAEYNHQGFPLDTTTIITEGTIGNITFAPANPLDKDHDRRLWGSNRYRDSYVRKYLNSDEFLNAVFTPDELAGIVETEIKTKQPDIDGGEIDTALDRLFLISMSEAGLEDEGMEGSILKLLRERNNLLAVDINGDSDWWWLRSAVVSNSAGVRHVLAGGSSYSNDAYSGFVGVRPACNLLSSNLVSHITEGE
jgi:hypothetical protein